MKFNSEIEINSNEAIIEAVQAGLGIGFSKAILMTMKTPGKLFQPTAYESGDFKR
jgi:DNA-binding transcriptional LysR family regulator